MTGAALTPRPVLRRWLCAGASFIAAVFAAGCIDTEQSIVINRDLGGKATFKMSMNLQPFITQLMNTMGAGSADPPPPEMLEQIKQGMMSQLSAGMFDVEASTKGLPAGITIADASQKMDGMTVAMVFNFAYTDIHKLPDISLLPRAASVGGTAPKPIQPFSGLEFREEGANLVIATKTPSPTPDASPQSPPANGNILNGLMEDLNDPGAKELIGSMMAALKGARMAIRIETPLTVVENNAPSKNGDVMLWEQKIDQVPATPEQLPSLLKPMAVLVKIKK